jgi:uncharacterized 2Fe-2S/4Fe-4S cluster protein (DUF4445 family)
VKNAQQFKIDFEPVGKRIKIREDQSLLDASQATGIQLSALCGGYGACGACKVRLMDGLLSPHTSIELSKLSRQEIDSNYRLACQAFPLSDVKIHIPQESLSTLQRLQLEGLSEEFDAKDSLIKSIQIKIPEPTIEDLRSDSRRIRDELKKKKLPIKTINFHYFTSMSDWMRINQWEFTIVTRNKELISVMPITARPLGLAIDIGSTKIAAYLVDLKTSKTLAKKGTMNPQISYGEDVVSRIAYANDKPAGREELQAKLIESINLLISELCKEAKQNSYQIVENVVVCNTAIHHFFLNFPVKQLGIYPFIPVIDESINIPAVSLGLDTSRGAYVYLPNNIAGYVGADHVAMLLATNTHKSKKTRIALDIGTNTEITLIPKEKMYCCSCASGPAFEGAHIKFGMRAADGAIEKVKIINGEVKYQTINNKKAVGICGSGILDVIGTLRAENIISERGYFDQSRPRVRPATKNFEYVIVDEKDSGINDAITITRSDINEIILAKSAIRTGIDVLLKEAGITADEIEEFMVAGAFGTYLSLENAIRIGMFPDIPIERFQQVGNAAGTGAQKLLLSESLRKECDELATRMHYIELTSYPEFNKILINNMRL